MGRWNRIGWRDLTRGVALSFLLTLGCTPALPEADVHMDRIRMPEGFHIALYAREVPGARSLALGTGGVVFVGSREEGKVYALVDENGDGVAEETRVLARDLNSPNGVAFRNGALYVAEVQRVIRFDRIMERLADPPPPVVVNDGFPDDPRHGWKYIAFGPDGKLYVPVGAPCKYLQSRGPPLWVHHAHGGRRKRCRDLCEGHPQYGWL